MLKRILFLGLALGIIPLLFAGCGEENNENSSIAKVPTSGPYAHTIHSATSADGLVWSTDINKTIAEHASVPTALQFPNGTIRVYYVDASDLQKQEKLGCQESTDNGETFQIADCSIDGLTSQKAVDFCIIPLSDGRYRMYYYAAGKKIDSAEAHNIDSAISADGLAFTRESTVFTYDGLVDPDVFYNGSQWILHSFSIAKQATVVAVSSDGLNFVYYGLLSPEKYAVTKPMALDDGTFRMYGFPQPNSSYVVSFKSQDGLSWAKEDGARLTVDSKFTITDPYVIKLQDGSYRMYYKLEKK